MPYYILDNGQWVEVVKPAIGQKYKFADSAGGMIESYWYEPEQDERSIYTLQNESVMVNGQSLQPFAGNYYCNSGDTIQLSAEIVKEGVIITSIDIPLTLKMPLIRHANGQPTQDEIYLNVTLTAGVMTASGVVERSGDWKLIIERNNEALQRIGVQWKLQHSDVTFLA